MMSPPPTVERRHRARREDDPDPEIVDGFARWFSFMLKHKLKITAVVTAISGLSGYVVGVRNVAALEVRMTHVEMQQQAFSADIAGLKNAARFQNFILCSARDTSSGTQIARLCQVILKQGIVP